MPRIAFVTDSDCSLPEDVAARYHIQQVPITVQFGEESFLASVNIDDAALFERVDRESKLPSTAAPLPVLAKTGLVKLSADAAVNEVLGSLTAVAVVLHMNTRL